MPEISFHIDTASVPVTSGGLHVGHDTTPDPVDAPVEPEDVDELVELPIEPLADDDFPVVPDAPPPDVALSPGHPMDSVHARARATGAAIDRGMLLISAPDDGLLQQLTREELRAALRGRLVHEER